jgi:hypothetical protein
MFVQIIIASITESHELTAARFKLEGWCKVCYCPLLTMKLPKERAE